MMHISVVTPVYGCKNSLENLYVRICNSIKQITSDFEIIMVNDSSPDCAWNEIVRLSLIDKRVKGLNLSRNFGQHYAISAGIEHSVGDWVVVMDCDLQDQPEEIVKLYNKAQEGYDIVLAQRIERKDNFIKRKGSQAFYSILGYLTETRQDNTVANFGIYRKKVIRAICSMGDSLRYFPAMVRWVGFKYISIPVEHSEREEGKTSYNFNRLFRLALDIVLSFSDKPLRLIVKLGFFISLCSFVFAVYNLYRFFAGQIVVSGWTSLIISIWFLSGVIICVLGMIGLYVGKTFDRVKGRPYYIVSEKVNLNE